MLQAEKRHGYFTVLAPSTPVPLTLQEFECAARNMREHGGGFAGHIAEAWFHADLTNRHRVEVAFDDFFRRYAAW